MIINRSGSMLAALAIVTMMAGCDNNGTSPKDAGRSPDIKTPSVTNENCVNLYAGIENCPINGATLSVEEAARTITVTDFPPDGSGGVSGGFANAGAWFQDLSLDLGDDGTLRYSASSEGNILGQLDVAAQGDHSFDAWATYSGEAGGPSNYSVHVYDGANLLGGQVSIAAGADNATNIANGNPAALADPPVTTAGFGNVGNGGVYAKRLTGPDSWRLEGACEWSLVARAGESFKVTLPDGTVLTGTKILFTEEVTPGHVVYSNFQRVDVQGKMNSYTITSEKSLPVP